MMKIPFIMLKFYNYIFKLLMNGAPGEITKYIPVFFPMGLLASLAVLNCSRQFSRTLEFSSNHILLIIKTGFNRPYLFGAPGEIRTPDQLVRSQLLYPAELQEHKHNL